MVILVSVPPSHHAGMGKEPPVRKRASSISSYQSAHQAHSSNSLVARGLREKSACPMHYCLAVGVLISSFFSVRSRHDGNIFHHSPRELMQRTFHMHTLQTTLPTYRYELKCQPLIRLSFFSTPIASCDAIERTCI